MLEAILRNSESRYESETNDEIKALGMHIRCDRLSRRKKSSQNSKERRQGHMKDALALGGEEGRDKLR